jgi:hypothetical protein
VIGRASDKMGAQTLLQLLPKVSNKDRSTNGDDGLCNAVIVDNVGYVELDILFDPLCRRYGYEVG